jgi:Fe-S cluster biogenesis protein NfuA
MPGAGTTRDVSHRVEQLLAELAEVAEVSVREKAEELARTLVELYGAGLARVLAMLAAQPGGEQQIRALAADSLVGSLLVLHDLHPVAAEDRVRAALENLRPQLGGRVAEFQEIDDQGVARIAVRGGGCRSSAAAAAELIDRAVQDAAPELAGAAVEPEERPPVLLQIQPYRAPGGQP